MWPPVTADSKRPRVPHLVGLDGVRVVATVLIIVIHGDHWPLQQQGADQAAWLGVDLLARVSVPLFVILSGLLLAYRRQDEMPLNTFVRRRLGRSLLPWVVWMPIYTLVGMYLTLEVPKDSSGVIAWWLLGGGHLWYLLLVPQLYVVFQFWPRGLRSTAVFAVLALALQTAVSMYRLYAPVDAPLQSLFLAYGYEFFFSWIGYFALGIAFGTYLHERGGRLPRWTIPVSWLAVVGGAVLLLLDNVSRAPNATFAQGTGAFLRPDLPLFTVAAFVAIAATSAPILHHGERLRSVVQAVSRYSLGIYIVHEALIYIPGRLLAPVLLQRHLPISAFGFVLLVAATLLIAHLATRLIVATPLAILVGLPPEPFSRRAAASD